MDSLRLDARFGSRIRCHLALGNLPLGEDGGAVIAVDPGSTAARQLCRAKGRYRDELERPHLVRRPDHRGPAAVTTDKLTDMFPHKERLW
jgi:hypothetical protein